MAEAAAGTRGTLRSECVLPKTSGGGQHHPLLQVHGRAVPGLGAPTAGGRRRSDIELPCFEQPSEGLEDETGEHRPSFVEKGPSMKQGAATVARLDPGIPMLAGT